MTQILKQEIRNSIINCSREEFIANGFEKASMRTIAKKSKISLSNIYNYFDNKDAIFEAVLQDTINELELAKKNISDITKSKKTLTYLNFDKSQVYFDILVHFVEKHKTNLRLLALQSYGSKLANYIPDWVDNYSKMEYLSIKNKFKGHKDVIKHIPSEFFINSLCKFFFKGVIDLIELDLPEKKFEQNLNEVFSFVYQGWDYYADF